MGACESMASIVGVIVICCHGRAMLCTLSCTYATDNATVGVALV